MTGAFDTQLELGRSKAEEIREEAEELVEVMKGIVDWMSDGEVGGYQEEESES